MQKLNLNTGLVLTRKEGQTILIGKDIAITVVRLRPCAVRLQITCPKERGVSRLEVMVERKHETIIDLTPPGHEKKSGAI